MRELVVLAFMLIIAVPGVQAEEPMASAAPADLDAMIGALDDPFGEQRGMIASAIWALPEGPQREELQARLDQRMEELMTRHLEESTTDVAAELTAPEVPELLSPLEEPALLSFEIDRLHVGPDATAEDLRRRDAVVAAIAAVEDPLLRDELLQQLSRKEQEAQR